MTASLGLLVLGLTCLYLGGEALVHGARAIGLRLGLSPLVVGLTIVAFGTSAPELAVSLDAALRGFGEVAIGNIAGSNIANLSLILGLAALVCALPAERALMRRDLPAMVACTALTAALLIDGVLSRVDGALLLGALAAYLGYTWRGVRAAAGGRSPPAPSASAVERNLALQILFVAAGIALLAAGADWLVTGGTDLARQLGVSEAAIALTVLAIGTSLPEIAACLVAVLRGQTALALGNVVGSNLLNLGLVLGLTASLVAVPRGDVGVWTLAVMLALSVLLWSWIRWRPRIARSEGAALVCGYASYASWVFLH